MSYSIIEHGDPSDAEVGLRTHITTLFVGGVCYWLMGDDWSATEYWEDAIKVLDTVTHVGDA